MKKYENCSLIDFQSEFDTEEKCWDHLVKLRWSEGFVCQKCGHTEYSFHSTRKLFQCKKCRHQVSATAGTVMHKTRTSLVKWFWMIFMIVNQKTGQSVKRMQEMLRIGSYNTAWLMAHKIRSAMKEHDSQYKLAGMVEVDDSYFGSPEKGKQGRGADGKICVVIGLEKKDLHSSGRAFLMPVANMTKVEVEPVIRKKIDNEAIIVTDGFSTYRTLKEDNLITEYISLRSQEKASKIFKGIHTVLSNVKAIIKGVHKGIKKKYLSNYLAEFIFKLNRRWKSEILFGRCLNMLVSNKTITLAELRA